MDLHTYKQNDPIRVKHEKSQYFNWVGNVIKATNKHVFVDFKNGGITQLFRWQIEPTTKYTDKSKPLQIESDVLARIEEKIKAEREHAAKYNTDAAVAVVALCDRLLSGNW